MKSESESEIAVVPDSQQPHGLQPTRLLRPWDFPGESTGVGCHCLLQAYSGILLSHKKKQDHASHRDVSEPRDYHTDGSKKDKRKEYILTYM